MGEIEVGILGGVINLPRLVADVVEFSPKDLNNGDTDAKPPKFGTPIVSASFNHNHEILA